MALTTCPECSGKVSDKAYSCPHCGFPLRDGISRTPQGKKPGEKAQERHRDHSQAVREPEKTLSGAREHPY